MQVTAAPRVLAVLVAHDGARWLPSALDTLEAQTHPSLDIVAVDNASTDGSRDILIERLGPDRVLVSDRDLGFGAAVSMALDARSTEAPYIWLLHDDVAFLPDALGHLVAALDEDPRLAVVGPKLRDWRDGERLQSVGWTIDRTGRSDSGVDPGELDQGQHDTRGRTLYVSTAGMLVRRDVMDDLGRFDRRFHVFRDDLDLCWRVWLTGHEVEVVPAALGAHVAAAAEYVRLGQTRHLGPRYFAERNTLAALLKNYGPARLPFVVALYLIVGIAKVGAFVVTRRLSDAWQTVRAWGCNLLHLRETWRLRRAVQRARTRTDTELKELFGRLTPRVRAYLEAVAYWVSGGDTPDPSREVEAEVAVTGNPVSRFVRQRPVAVAGLGLLALMTFGAWPLLVPGELRGGQLAPWPASSAMFFQDYVAGWHQAAGFGTSATPSPAQALLGMLQFVLGGSSYLAPRVLLFGSIAAAWLFALRAAQAYSPRRVPRVVAATAYVLSPPALAALVTGQVAALVLLAVIPGLVASGLALTGRSSPPGRAWRAVSGSVLLGAIGGAFEPLFVPVVLLAGLIVVMVIWSGSGDGAWRRAVTVRVLAAVSGPLLLLLPWSLDLIEPGGPLFAGSGALAGGELWRWLALSPDLAGFPGLIAGVGFVLAGLLGLAIGLTRTPRLVVGLWAVALLGAVSGWLLGRTGTLVWPGLPLVLTAAAFAGLYALAFATAEHELGRFGFGWRQMAAVVTAAAVTISLGAVALSLVRSPLDDYAVDDPPLPAFIGAAAQEAPFRVLVLADTGGGVSWEVVDGGGPTMAGFGVPASPALELVSEAVSETLGRVDSTAASLLGPLNIRYVVVPDGGTSAELDAALRGQFALESRPVAEGRVYSVAGWMPRATVVDAPTAWEVIEHGARPDAGEVHPLEAGLPGMFSGTAPLRGPVLVAEADDGQWTATADGVALGALEFIDPDAPSIVGFSAVNSGERVEIAHGNAAARRLEVTGQAIALLLIVSLALRPPRFARRERAIPAPEPHLDLGGDDR